MCPMRYLLKQKLFAFGNDFTIKDAGGQDRYFVDGRIFAIGDKLTFHDMQGQELARIEQKLLRFSPTYEIIRSGRPAAVVKKQRFTFFRDMFDIEDAAPGDLDASGDFFDLEYQFTRDGRPIATISKRFFSLSDTYGVDIAEGEDDVLILACTVVIDMCSHSEGD